jgi:hypothetical protein
MHELWGVTSYRKRNKFLSTASILDLAKELPDNQDLLNRIAKLTERYQVLAQQYHREKPKEGGTIVFN